MLAKAFDMLFGCGHRNYSFPMTLKGMTLKGGRTAAAAASGTYVVCLECGRELPYSWHEMRVVSGRAIRPPGAPEKPRGQPAAIAGLAEWV
jgi:hypothetical protein